MYKAQISLAKISVCLFLLRIFQSTAFRYTTYVIMGLNAAIAVTWMMTDSLRCIPVHLSWTGWLAEEEGKCVDFMTVTFVNAFVNIAVDTAMVLMPVYEISKLNLSARKKAGVSVMFAMGLVYVLSSCAFLSSDISLTTRQIDRRRHSPSDRILVQSLGEQPPR